MYPPPPPPPLPLLAEGSWNPKEVRHALEESKPYFFFYWQAYRVGHCTVMSRRVRASTGALLANDISTHICTMQLERGPIMLRGQISMLCDKEHKVSFIGDSTRGMRKGRGKYLFFPSSLCVFACVEVCPSLIVLPSLLGLENV